MAQYCMAGVGEEVLLLFSLKFSVGFNINLVADCWYCHTFLYSLFLAFFFRDLSMSAQRMVLIFTKEQCLVVRYTKLCWH